MRTSRAMREPEDCDPRGINKNSGSVKCLHRAQQQLLLWTFGASFLKNDIPGPS